MDMLAAMRIYIRVVDCGTLSGAARELNVGQPAISERLARLEEHLGIQLLTRTARSLSCTEAGKKFYELSINTIESVDGGLHAIKSLDTSPSGTLCIAVPICFDDYIMSSALLKIRSIFPDVRVELRFYDVQSESMSDDVDLMIRVGPTKNERLMAFNVGTIHGLLFCSKEYLEKNNGIQQISDLEKHPFINQPGFSSGEKLSLVNDQGDKAQVMINEVMAINHWGAIFQMIKEGQGVGLLPNVMSLSANAEKTLVRIFPGYRTEKSVPVFIMLQERLKNSLKIRNALTAIKDAILGCNS